MFPRCFVVCTLLLAPWLAGVAQPNLLHLGRNILLPSGQEFHNAGCILCSADVEGRATGSVRVFAGNVFLTGSVGGNVLVFGGNVTLTSNAKVDGRVVVFGGHLHQDPAAVSHTSLIGQVALRRHRGWPPSTPYGPSRVHSRGDARADESDGLEKRELILERDHTGQQ